MNTIGVCLECEAGADDHIQWQNGGLLVCDGADMLKLCEHISWNSLPNSPCTMGTNRCTNGGLWKYAC